MKRILVAVISFFILIIIMTALIVCLRRETVIKDNGKLQIIATLFPQYDFAKHIVGDKAEVKLLLNSGVETHHYEPTPKDMIEMNHSDLFLFTGTQLEPWTEGLIGSIEQDCKIVDISEGIDLITVEDFEKKHLNSEIISKKEQENEHIHEELYDGHIWLNPLNSVKMIDNIVENICMVDRENAEYYRKNAENYKQQILTIDSEIEDTVQHAIRDELAFGGEFAYAYFIERYNLKFVSVYTNCGEGEDPSINRVKSVIDYINNKEIPIVFYEELSEGTVAKMIAEETNAESYVLYSIHNANIQEDTYLSLMKRNLDNLKKALNE